MCIRILTTGDLRILYIGIRKYLRKCSRIWQIVIFNLFTFLHGMYHRRHLALGNLIHLANRTRSKIPAMLAIKTKPQLTTAVKNVYNSNKKYKTVMFNKKTCQLCLSVSRTSRVFFCIFYTFFFLKTNRLQASWPQDKCLKPLYCSKMDFAWVAPLNFPANERHML